MKLVIDIPEVFYEALRKTDVIISGQRSGKTLMSVIFDAVAKGTPLPTGHGRLIDADKLKVELECGIKAGNYEEGYEEYAHINDMDDCVDAVEYADTIIEADKAEGSQ